MSGGRSPLAGRNVPAALLLDVPALLAAYDELRPDPTVAEQRVAFGTSGHRGVAFERSFNAWHVLAISQAICDHRKRKGIDGPLFLGIDTHAVSQPALRSTLQVLAANGVETAIAEEGQFTPTPAISHAILSHNRGRGAGLADGIVLTPSHNPPDSGGLKYNPPHGGPADTEVTGWIQARANALLEDGLAQVRTMPHARALRAATTRRHDYLGAYVEDLGRVVDFDAIRGADLHLGVDPLGGAGVHYWGRIAERYRLDLSVVSEQVDPRFGFMSLDWDGTIRMDPSSPDAMRRLIDLKQHYDVAFGCDPDHDRHGIVTRGSGLLPANHYLAVLVDYLFRHRPQWRHDAAVGKTVVSSALIDRVTQRLGRRLHEVPVGFKWFVEGLLDGSLGVACEESAGASFSRIDGTVWTTDKDGIAAALLAAEITARSGRDPGERYRELARELGEPVADRVEAPASIGQKRALAQLSARTLRSARLAGEPIVQVLDRAPGNDAPIGGIKVIAADGWFAARPSGTEAVYKIYAESFRGPGHLRDILDEARHIVDTALAQAAPAAGAAAPAPADPAQPGRAPAAPLAPGMLHRIDAYWRAANYLSVGQIYLRDNPLLRRPLAIGDIKSMLLGHWGTSPGQNFVYAHLNRAIVQYDLDMIYVCGPGHGGPTVVANTYLEGSYSEIYPAIGQDEDGLRRLFRQFSFPGGIPSHASPECPGSIHEGGELGYSLSHAFGAAFDNPGLLVACVIGDGEAETGPLAAAWHSNKFLDPVGDGAVLPILHLNGYKIANPTVLARIPREELDQLLRGYGWTPLFVEGSEPLPMHQAMAEALDQAIAMIGAIQRRARRDGDRTRPCWPMIVLASPKGWTGPKLVDGLRIEGSFRAHQVPIPDPAVNPEHLALLEDWLRSYRPDELFDAQGRLHADIAALAPHGERRMGANPHANGGLLLRDLQLPDFRDYAIAVPAPGVRGNGDTRALAPFLRDVIRLNQAQRNFRIFGPDETISNGLQAVFEATTRQWNADTQPGDEWLAPSGRIVEMLSEHQCEGWLEGYLLTGRHGLFNCYEAFIHIVDSMFNQHAKWLKVSAALPWRRPIASLNYLLASHVWRQDHNGFTHQDPGFIDHVVNKKASVVRVYLPPDANCLLAVMDHCLRSRHYVNVVVAGKHPAPQWLTMEAAARHCAAGIGVWHWAGNENGTQPDLVMACCGDVPTLETLAAVSILRTHLPALTIRVVNVVDLMKLQPAGEHPHGLTDAQFDAVFTADRPVVFAFHGYPWLIHRLTYRRSNQQRIHVRGYKEEGTITTPFDMTVLNELDRFHLAIDAVDRVTRTGDAGIALKRHLADQLAEHTRYIREHGRDMPQIRDWVWPAAAPVDGA
jgi:xylulose-5-phosphate/fructose-6-phosphate phosphoketolase